mmetsp:Transcript_40661/g.87313  ORF Transcript_40661/g.87313 Transcript_40661/m.87313 type:complete len:90 (+) Transcript_40661:244-513(+)
MPRQHLRFLLGWQHERGPDVDVACPPWVAATIGACSSSLGGLFGVKNFGKLAIMQGINVKLEVIQIKIEKAAPKPTVAMPPPGKKSTPT